MKISFITPLVPVIKYFSWTYLKTVDIVLVKGNNGLLLVNYSNSFHILGI